MPMSTGTHYKPKVNNFCVKLALHIFRLDA